MAGLAGGWVFYFGIGLTAVATALLFVKAIRRDRRLALFLAPAAANAALLLLSFSFYGQLSVEVASTVFQSFLAGQFLLAAVLIYACRRRWPWALTLGALNLVFAVPFAAIGAMALADSWL